jgi:DNA-directed RNA polymerase subunit RPC12/RpoP
MVFDADTGKLTCPSCRNRLDIESIPENLRGKPSGTEADRGRPSGPAGAADAGDTVTYHCNNCGADLLTTPETAATRCSFCGAGVVIAERLSGEVAPHLVIPFKISKEEAIKAFKRWCRNGLLTPRGFMTADRIQSITGIYVPYWLYDLNSHIKVSAVCTKVRTYTSGDYMYTETSYFDAYREINLNYVKVPADASRKMDDELMDKLEPFHYGDLKVFKTPYLAGFLAEKYQYTDNELMPRVKDKIGRFVEEYIRSTYSGYSSVRYKSKQIDTSKVQSYYVLFPVWLVVYDYDNFKHTFAMNGQTGKVVGKPPISYGKVAAWFGGIAAGTMLVFKTVSLALGGGFL